jgi:hypothetical protein
MVPSASARQAVGLLVLGTGWGMVRLSLAGFWGHYGPRDAGSRDRSKWNIVAYQWFVKIIFHCHAKGFALLSAVAETLGKITG